MATIQDLPHIRATLVNRIAQHLLTPNYRIHEQSQQPVLACPEALRAIEDEIAHWREQVKVATTDAGRDHALEKVKRLTQFLDAGPAGRSGEK